MKTLKIDTAFSPCPNDTFIFHAMLHGLVDVKKFYFKSYISDVEDLNNKAFIGRYKLTKLSFHAYLLLKNRYSILNSGAALGFKCGPLLIAKENLKNIERMNIAIPGKYTTANLLLKLWNPNIINTTITSFDKIIEGVRDGLFDAGLIIHEGRFVYSKFNLIKIIDLGEWWEKETDLPIPLGCIALRMDLDMNNIKEEINEILKASIEYALINGDDSKEFIKSHANILDDRVIKEHINLYVNSFTVELGNKGEKAIQTLEEMARWRGIIK